MSRHALILAGGSGTRLWPMSTAGRPKQLLPVLHGQSLLDLAIERARSAVAPDAVWLGVGAGLASALPDTVARDRVVVEPSGRDTLPAIGLAMAAIAAADPHAVVAVLTADHVIEPVEDFAATLGAAFEVAERDEGDGDVLVTFGVEPDHAATGFGYVELGEPLPGGVGRRVSRFREKPDRATAESFLAAGPQRYLWNSGMFVWRAETFLRALDAFCPDDAGTLRELGAAFGTSAYDDLAARTWESITRRSVDYAVMEPASTSEQFVVAALPLATRWLDVGSWPALGDALGRDAAGNAVAGQTLVLDSTGCVAISADPQAPLVTLVGCEDLVVVATANAVLVVPADQAQRVKELQAEVARVHRDLA